MTHYLRYDGIAGKRYEDTKELLRTVRQNMLTPTGSMYAALMSAANKAGHHKECIATFHEARAALPNAFNQATALCIAVEANVRLGDWRAAGELLREMRTQRKLGEPGVVFDNALQACADSGPKEFVYQWLDEIIVADKLKTGARVPRPPFRDSVLDQ
jgi:hypothetical protein